MEGRRGALSHTAKHDSSKLAGHTNRFLFQVHSAEAYCGVNADLGNSVRIRAAAIMS